ncbi:hypothetical protein Tco_1015005 [Tanacetum coccineum]
MKHLSNHLRYKKKQQTRMEKREKEQKLNLRGQQQEDLGREEDGLKKEKKKVEDDDKDYEIEEPQDKSVKKKKIERQFKSLRAKTLVKPLYEVTKTLTPERKTEIRDMGFGTLLDFPFEKILGKLPYFVVKNLDTKKMKVTFPSGSELKITPKKIWEVLGIPMGKNKLESDSPREYDDEFL